MRNELHYVHWFLFSPILTFYFIQFQSDIVDVNTTFKNKELPTMVHEQGIEFNVETVRIRVEEGTSQSATCKVIQKMETMSHKNKNISKIIISFPRQKYVEGNGS